MSFSPPHSVIARSALALTGFAIALAIAAAGCGSSSSTTTGPSPVKCQVSLATTVNVIAASGGTGTARVNTQPECTWTASAAVNWISGLSPTSGQGNGQVDFQVTANPTPTVRQGDIVVNDNNLRIEQAAAPCVFEVAPRTKLVNPSGGAGEVTVSTASDCTWSAISEVSWIAITSPASGTGSGAVSYDVAENTGPARSGSLMVAGQASVVTQAAATTLPPGCTYVIRPTALAVSAAGGVSAVTVTAGAGCPWTATSSASWITITSGGSGSGDGSVNLNIAANTTALRNATLTIAGHAFSVTQASAGGCAYAISPASESIPAAGGAGTPVSVSTAAGCVWSAASNAPWITITAGGTGSGNGSVGFNVAANPGASRTGTITIADQTFTVTQAAPASCAYAINPTSQSIGALGGAGTPVAVTTSAGCAWTATSNAPWITLTTGAGGSGNGSVGFNVGANPGGGRSGTITIAGETFTVTQAAAPSCAYAISPTSQSIGAPGGAGTPVALSTSATCAWTSTSNVSWLTITSGASGSGNGSVSFTVSVNTGGSRSGTLSIAGETFTVMQASAPTNCTYAINPTKQSIGAPGGPGTPVAVSSGANCAWTAASNAPWIILTTGANGSGNGTVTFTIAPNVGSDRIGTLTIAGHTFEVTQAGAVSCTYKIAPRSDSISAAGGTLAPVAVTTDPRCGWTATSNDGWIAVTAGARGDGDGTVSLTVAANFGPARTGTVTIAGETFTVAQAATCVYTINPTSDSIGAGGGNGSPVQVSAASGCAWTATSNVPWITITSSAIGDGNGVVRFSVALNLLLTRIGTLTIAGQTFTVTQAGLLGAPATTPVNQAVR